MTVDPIYADAPCVRRAAPRLFMLPPYAVLQLTAKTTGGLLLFKAVLSVFTIILGHDISLDSGTPGEAPPSLAHTFLPTVVALPCPFQLIIPQPVVLPHWVLTFALVRGNVQA